MKLSLVSSPLNEALDEARAQRRASRDLGYAILIVLAVLTIIVL